MYSTPPSILESEVGFGADSAISAAATGSTLAAAAAEMQVASLPFVEQEIYATAQTAAVAAAVVDHDAVTSTQSSGSASLTSISIAAAHPRAVGNTAGNVFNNRSGNQVIRAGEVVHSAPVAKPPCVRPISRWPARFGLDSETEGMREEGAQEDGEARVNVLKREGGEAGEGVGEGVGLQDVRGREEDPFQPLGTQGAGDGSSDIFPDLFSGMLPLEGLSGAGVGEVGAWESVNGWDPLSEAEVKALSSMLLPTLPGGFQETAGKHGVDSSIALPDVQQLEEQQQHDYSDAFQICS